MEIDYDNIPNPKVKIYAETAKYIFKKCYVLAADIKSQSKNSAMFARVNGDEYILAAVLNSLIKKQPITGRFLKAKLREANELTAEGKRYETVGFDHHYILTLAVFANIDDYVKLNRSFGPVTAMPVLLVYKPFSLFKFIRVPLHGLLSEDGEKWDLVADNGTKLSGNETRSSLYTMPGDRLALWVQVTYQADNKSHTIYLAQGYNSQIQPAGGSTLKAFFDRFAPVV